MIPIHLKRVPVCVRPDYTILYERIIGHTFIHCTVNARWTPGVKRRLMADFEVLCGLIRPEPLWAQHAVGDEKHRKFLEMFGFRFDSAWNDSIHIYKKET